MAGTGAGFGETVSEGLLVHEIYASVQGESTWAGWPCIFVRLTGCPLRCSYCDTAYAFRGGVRMETGAVKAEVRRLAGLWLGRGSAGTKLPLVEFTGGEPLAQRGVLGVMRDLCDEGFTVLLETSGALDIGAVDSRVVRIMDLKAPSSGEVGRNRWENIELLRSHDEVKFVLGSEEDYEWMVGLLEEHGLAARCTVLVSWVAPLTVGQADDCLKPVPEGHHPIGLRALAERVVADGLPVRFQVQMHKVIWSPEQRGV
ncbi:MAG: hypothetical protein RI897_2498 [Verrucomicrobiota bacterium]